MSTLYGMTTTDAATEWVTARGVEPLLLMVSGSHAWNLARPDSDLDIRGVYLDPLDKVLSIHPGRDTIEALGQLGGAVDFQLYELRKVFGMLLNHNGNVVEMLLSPTMFQCDLRIPWIALAQRFLTKQLAKHYEGYFHSQRKRAAMHHGGKGLVYSYRELFAGVHLMETGHIEYDFHRLKAWFEGRYWESEMLDWFMEDTSRPVGGPHMARFEVEWQALVEALHGATERSGLPERHDGYDELNGILVEMRRGTREWSTRAAMAKRGAEGAEER